MQRRKRSVEFERLFITADRLAITFAPRQQRAQVRQRFRALPIPAQILAIPFLGVGQTSRLLRGTGALEQGFGSGLLRAGSQGHADQRRRQPLRPTISHGTDLTLSPGFGKTANGLRLAEEDGQTMYRRTERL